ncbi:hypothetical protein SAMN05443668_11866 [Cryptosporangium aurantiacum]|uniref:Uncharacterized protein n=1 Tax=Cryptosporangium aurantiacum TaxID=134849 RepID=A0A1M7RKP0_9ACTN|nr:hypothetical protein SAMN05443668_11866 [Cryptosporangium aurantiacum]
MIRGSSLPRRPRTRVRRPTVIQAASPGARWRRRRASARQSAVTRASAWPVAAIGAASRRSRRAGARQSAVTRASARPVAAIGAASRRSRRAGARQSAVTGASARPGAASPVAASPVAASPGAASPGAGSPEAESPEAGRPALVSRWTRSRSGSTRMSFRSATVPASLGTVRRFGPAWASARSAGAVWRSRANRRVATAALSCVPARVGSRGAQGMGVARAAGWMPSNPTTSPVSVVRLGNVLGLGMAVTWLGLLLRLVPARRRVPGSGRSDRTRG